MPKPSVGSVHQNTALGNVAANYANQDFPLAMGQVFPIVPVKNENDLFYKWTGGDIFRNEAKIVGAGGTAPRGGFSFTTDTYRTEMVKFAWPIPDRVRKNADRAIHPDLVAVRRCMEKVYLYKEIVLTTLLKNTSVFTKNGDGSDWTTASTGTPIADGQAAVKQVRKNCGRKANVAVIDEDYFLYAMQCDEVLDLIRYTGNVVANLLSTSWLAQAWGVKKVVVSPTVYQSANEGQTEVALSSLMGNKAWFGYVPTGPSIDEPSAGYIFRVGTPMVRTWREDAAEQDVIEAGLNDVAKATMADAAYVLTGLDS